MCFDGLIRLIFPGFWFVIDSFELISHQSETRKDQSDVSIKMDCSFEDTAVKSNKKKQEKDHVSCHIIKSVSYFKLKLSSHFYIYFSQNNVFIYKNKKLFGFLSQ